MQIDSVRSRRHVRWVQLLSKSTELRSVSLDDLNVGGRALKQQSEWQQWYYTESQSHTVYPLISLLHWFSPLLRENLFCVDWYWREIRSELWAEEIIQTSSASLIWVSSGRQHADRVKQVSQDDDCCFLCSIGCWKSFEDIFFFGNLYSPNGVCTCILFYHSDKYKKKKKKKSSQLLSNIVLFDKHP